MTEKLSSSEIPLDPKSRRSLLSLMNQHNKDWYPKMALAGRGQLTEMLTIITYLTEVHDSKEAAHLRRMAAIESRRVPQILELPGDRQFWEQVIELGGAEYQEAQEFQADLSDLPRSWQTAFNDLAKLESARVEA